MGNRLAFCGIPRYTAHGLARNHHTTQSCATSQARNALCTIERVSQAAKLRWENGSGPLTTLETSSIMDCMQYLTASTLDIHPPSFAALHRSTVAYISVQDTDSATCAVFVLPPRASIPLHDHPGMTVFSKVLWGTLHVHSYDVGDDSQVVRAPEEILQSDEISLLTPTSRNIHSFVAPHNAHVAVLDVVVPPYDPSCNRNCNYYHVDARPAVGAPAFLSHIAPPPHFVTTDVPYTGVIAPLS